MQSISLAILTKNAEDSLEPLLEQCAPYAHEIIILDGFSNDGTLDIAEKYNAKVFKSPFNGSFTILRNHLLELCSGEYVLMLDSDETLEDVAGVFNKTYTDNAYAFPRHTFIDYVDMPDLYPDYQTRLIKKSSGLKYDRDVHEIINTKPSLLNTHIIHDKHNALASHDVYTSIMSANKFKNNAWLELIDIMNADAVSGWYDAELFPNGDMARWCSSDATVAFDCNAPNADILEIRISTFGEYGSIDITVEYDDNVVGALNNIISAGIYKVPINIGNIAPCKLIMKVTGNNKIKDFGDTRDLCVFIDYVALTGNHVNGYLKMLWNPAQKYLMSGFKYDVAIMSSILASGWWETDNLTVLNKYLSADSICLDIGANIGALTIPMANIANHVYAFEPGPQIFGMLNTNIIDNNIKNVTLINAAISNKKDTVYFHHNRSNVGGSYVTANEDAHSTSAVPAIRLDTWAKDNLDRLDFIKCDIEGFEVKFIKGAKQTLKKYKPMMLIEFNPVAFKKNNSEETAEDLFKELTAIYDYIYVIEGNAQLRRVTTYEDACARIDGTSRTLEDLLCYTSEL